MESASIDHVLESKESHIPYVRNFIDRNLNQ